MGGAEFEFVREAFATNWIAPLGPQVDAFEKEFAAVVGSPHAAALSSGTAALHLALRLLDVGPGDEIFCSTFTFIATANPIIYQGAKPVFIDSDRVSWNMDPALLTEALEARAKHGRLPKAVVLVHLYGQSADIDPIAAACDRHGVTLIEDAAEALGATYHGHAEAAANRHSPEPKTQNPKPETPSPPSSTSGSKNRQSVAPGTVGKFGVFSFNGNKIITTSGGGMLVSRDGDLIAKARFLATQARDPAPHYQHSEIGFNYRLSNVLAGIGRGQLQVLEARVAARRRNFDAYRAALADLPGVAFMPEAGYGRCTRWLTCIIIDPKKFGADREAVRQALADENIEARPVWKPLHLQPVFAGCECRGGSVAEGIFSCGLCLPSGSNLPAADLERVVAVVRRCHR